jgi:uncharacterized surface protein with fasciclin (FAS1) repeats
MLELSGYCVSQRKSLLCSIDIILNLRRRGKDFFLPFVGFAPVTSQPKTIRNISMTTTHDIVDTAVAAGSFKTLVAAVTAAGLVETLKGAGPFTVFAPSDEAFAKLPAGTVDSLVLPENKAKLAAILTLHVMAGKVMAADVTGKKLSPASVNGEELNVDGTSGVTVNGAKVTSADIACTNGVIHVIDTVLMPKA